LCILSLSTLGSYPPGLKVEHVQGFSSGRPLIIIKCVSNGSYLACGYMSVDTAESFGEVCGIIGGVDTADDFLHKPIGKLTSAAKSAGLKEVQYTMLIHYSIHHSHTTHTPLTHHSHTTHTPLTHHSHTVTHYCHTLLSHTAIHQGMHGREALEIMKGLKTGAKSRL
jgi:uncharacterized protein YunC (DUF1805 family)